MLEYRTTTQRPLFGQSLEAVRKFQISPTVGSHEWLKRSQKRHVAALPATKHGRSRASSDFSDSLSRDCLENREGGVWAILFADGGGMGAIRNFQTVSLGHS
jgi:hypothetical protein